MKILVVEGDSGTMVYCKGCGAVAGIPSECLCWSSHEFVSTKVPVICKGCGAIPGKSTTSGKIGRVRFRKSAITQLP